MSRKPLLTLSLLLPLMASASVAHAGPTITNKNYWPNEVGPSSYYKTMPTAPDRLRARAKQRGAPSVQTAPVVNRQGCRYLGGPKYPITC